VRAVRGWYRIHSYAHGGVGREEVLSVWRDN